MSVALGGDRARPLHFAGRKHELEVLHGRMEFVAKEQDAEGGIVLIDGIQGIGKTALLREFARQAVTDETPYAAKEVVHLPLVADELAARPPDLAAVLLNSIPSAAPKDVVGAKREVSRAFAWIRKTVKRVPGFELRVQADLPLNHLLRESVEMGWWEGRALLLTIDEIQNINGAGRENLAILHEGRHGCPIFVVCAGLQHSRQVLQDPMQTENGAASPTISRLSTLTLAMLSRQESIEVVVQSVRRGSDCYAVAEDLAGRIADAVQGFPQHLHGYVESCLNTLKAFDSLDESKAKERVMAEGDDARRMYYEGRLTSFAPDEGIALSHLAAEARQYRGRTPWGDAARTVDAAGIGTNGRELLNAAIRKGVVAVVEGTTDLVFPIPPLMEHLASRVEAS